MSELQIEFFNSYPELKDSDDLKKIEKAQEEFMQKKALEIGMANKLLSYKAKENIVSVLVNEGPIHASFFRGLNNAEEEEFRQWARENYKLHDNISEMWHPVVKDECRKMNADFTEKI